ncbi:MAG: outer membrane beta-barrel protein [Bacteroidota bacterium]
MARTLLSLFIMTAFLSISAQNFKGGLSLGLNGSQVDGDGLAGFRKVGITGGLYLQYPVSELVDVQLEILYSPLGSLDRFRISGLRSSYIDFPLLVNFHLPLEVWDEKEVLNLEGGLAFGYLLVATSPDRFTDFTDAYRSVDTRFMLGVVVDLGEKTHLGLRYARSLYSVLRGGRVGVDCFRGFGLCNEYVNLVLRYDLLGRD